MPLKTIYPSMSLPVVISFVPNRTNWFTTEFSVVIFLWCCTYLSKSGVRKSSKWSSKWRSPATILQVLLFGNIGLIIVDHIHFQYNGFLYGILLISISKLFQAKCLQSAIYFTILLNLKHIFIYVAPPYFIYLLRNYCFLNTTPGLTINWNSFSRNRFFKLSSVVIVIFLISFGPFIILNQMKQIILRLFPFKRGLCHAYWAPNFWALYNTIDRILALTLQKFSSSHTFNNTMTRGLVQDIEHTVFPNVHPKTTFFLTFLTILPCLIKLWRWPEKIYNQ
ncbi:dolichyl glycosyltransferase, putative [Pediculus humanus corporis]|uniref:Alpha-1,3-glucosyltransferase n=1 Tax=Pediculus humanus subsp. corporis TaxID=121224 RepID=E0VDQ8_PEDHC|nr:dolichyl glycosyltransferase, putative [Pediculus humanus corporis]EEB11514.1 dolichyl glycosyltransferase, putative [Pediculus humanus corporis]